MTAPIRLVLPNCMSLICGHSPLASGSAQIAVRNDFRSAHRPPARTLVVVPRAASPMAGRCRRRRHNPDRRVRLRQQVADAGALQVLAEFTFNAVLPLPKTS